MHRADVWPPFCRIAAESGVERIVHISDMAAAKDHKSKRMRTKAEGDEALLKAFPNATVLRYCTTAEFCSLDRCATGAHANTRKMRLIYLQYEPACCMVRHCAVVGANGFGCIARITAAEC